MSTKFGKILGVAGASLLTTVVLTNPLYAQAWSQLFPTGGPPVPRYSPTYAYDDLNDRLILFSGEDDITPAPPRLQDVWVLTNATGLLGAPSWVQLFPTGGPPTGRFGGTAVYDPTSNRLIVHGGCNSNCGFSRSDVWVLTNANGIGGSPNWLPIASAPIGRAEHSAAYDPVNNRMMVFGGHTAFFGTDRNDVWVLSDANGIGSPSWNQLFPTGSPPSGRRATSAVYDQASNRLILFGGVEPPYVSPADYLNDTWILTNANGLGGTPQWIQLSPSGTPARRAAHSAVYDLVTNRMTVFGGSDGTSNYNSASVLTSSSGVGGTPQWIPLAPSGTPPPVRHYHATGYSTAGNRMAVTLGRTASPVPNDLWVLTDANGIAITEISIDIKPGSDPNSINPRSKGKIPLAILTTSTADGDPIDFDAWDVDPLTLEFGPDGAPIAHSQGYAEDADGDGDLDMVVHFKTQQTGIACGDTEATLTGETFGGQQIEGTDAIQTAGCAASASGATVLVSGSGPTDRFSDRARHQELRRAARKAAKQEAAAAGPNEWLRDHRPPKQR